MKFSFGVLLLAAAATKASENQLRGGHRKLTVDYTPKFSEIDLCDQGTYNKCEKTLACDAGYKIQSAGFVVMDCTGKNPKNANTCASGAAGARSKFTLIEETFGWVQDGPATSVTYKGMSEDSNAALRVIIMCEEIV